MQGDFAAFYDSAVHNSNKLFVMIVDECHYGATLGQAHDTYVNDYNWLDDDDSIQHGPQKDRSDKLSRRGEAKPTRSQHCGKLLQQENFLTLLVSATPYSMLTDSSRIPDSLFVPCQLSSNQQVRAEENGLSPLNVLSKHGATWQISSSYPRPCAQTARKLDAHHVLALVSEKVCSRHMCLPSTSSVQSILVDGLCFTVYTLCHYEVYSNSVVYDDT